MSETINVTSNYNEWVQTITSKPLAEGFIDVFKEFETFLKEGSFKYMLSPVAIDDGMAIVAKSRSFETSQDVLEFLPKLKYILTLETFAYRYDPSSQIQIKYIVRGSE
jgi:hypothetical protein